MLPGGLGHGLAVPEACGSGAAPLAPQLVGEEGPAGPQQRGVPAAAVDAQHHEAGAAGGYHIDKLDADILGLVGRT